jgi:hypothetical protein
MSPVHVVASAIRERCARSCPPGREERTSPKHAPAAVAYRFVAAIGLSVACGASDGGTERRGPARAAPPAIIAKDTKGFRSWAFSGALHAAAAKATFGGRAFTRCASHVGCMAAAPALPRCTDPGEIPAGLRHFRGTLEHYRGYRQTLAAEYVLECNNVYRAEIKTSSGKLAASRTVRAKRYIERTLNGSCGPTCRNAVLDEPDP